MDELHQYICQQACSRTGLPNIPLDSIGSIPPPPPSSTFIGERWLNEGPPSEPVVRVMFRCVSPPESASRHVLLHMKPSVTEESLAMKLCQIFEIPANGGVITKTMPKFMPGRDFLTIPGKGMILSSTPHKVGLRALTYCSLHLCREIRGAWLLHSRFHGGNGCLC